MDTILFEVLAPNEAMAQLKARRATGKPDKYARLTFASAEDMARTLTPGRWAIVQALTGAGPLGVRELARRVGRDVKGVHADAQALARNGVIERTDGGKLSFPYARVKVQFDLRSAA